MATTQKNLEPATPWSKELAVVMPVFNEADIILTVVQRWIQQLSKLQIDFILYIYDGGSTDGTLEKLQTIADKRVVVQPLGLLHGPSVVHGYNLGIEVAEWILQVDSDNEMRAENFVILWYNRKSYDLLLGRRWGRKSSLLRRCVSFSAKTMLRLLCGCTIQDVNTPYRLFNSAVFYPFIRRMDPNTAAPNIIISGIAAKCGMVIGEYNFTYFPRTTGKAVSTKKLLKATTEAFTQTIKYFRSLRYACGFTGRRIS